MKTLFILSLFKEGYKIKISTLYHLLKGKRTVSVLMNGILYGNLNFFQIFPDLTEEEYQKQIQKNAAVGYLDYSEVEGTGRITEKGQSLLAARGKELAESTVWLDSYRFGKIEEELWRLLQFSVQVTSQLSYKNKTYIPLEFSPYYQWRIKRALVDVNRSTIGRQMRQEWGLVLTELSEEERLLIVSQFSGFQWNGKAVQQLLTSSADWKNQLALKNSYHHLFNSICQNKAAVFLNHLLEDSLLKGQNQSMLETKRLVLSGKTPAQIAGIRNMKASTVNDHLIEWAVQEPDWAFEELLDQEVFHQLTALTQPCQLWLFAELKKTMPMLDYFTFRMGQIFRIQNRGE